MIISADTNEDEIVEDYCDNEYSGNFDKNKLKTGAGDLKWNHKIYQRYQGQFFQDCLHGRGRYSWSEGDDCILFKGNFYANKLEGYGKFYYNDCQVFEGLFKDSERFGPGVFTYKNGSQDVGMWIGKNLMRLCTVINGDWIPRIARTSTSKVKLLKHKKLIPIYNETLDKARNILEMLEVHEEVLKQSDKLYNIHIRNTNSNFFNSKLYEDRYFCEKDCFIEVALTPSEMKTYYEERDSQSPDEIITEEDSEKKLCCEEVPSDVFCVCENPKQVRINGIKLELERIETCMKKTEWKIKIARCRKKSAKKREREAKKAKRLSWKTVGMQSATGENETGNFECKSANGLLSFSQVIIIEDEDDELEDEYNIEDEYDVKDEYEEESTDEDCDNIISQDDEIDYETACQQLTAAKRSLEILFIKKLKLTDILNIEYSESEGEEENECETQLTKRVLITDLLAWNNEELSIDMMKHAFLHRNFENGVPFCVSDILCGNRSSFKDIGIYEESCGNFLTECSNGNCQEALNIFYKYDLNPDLCDSRGNTGIIYASARDNIKMIKILVNLGANVDSVNDECFTSLGMCMLKYLAIQNKVTDWEKAFLKFTDLEIKEEANNIQFEWRPHVSLVSLNTVQQLNENHSADNLENTNRNRGSKHISRRLELLSEIFGSNLDLIHSNNFIESIMDINNRLSNIKSSFPDVQERFIHKLDDKGLQSYLFATDCIKPPPEKKKKKKKEKKKKGKKGKKDKKEKKKSDKSSKTSSKKSKKKNKKSPTEVSIPSLTIAELTPEEILLNNRLNLVFNTMVELLTRGASPNVCEVPQPTLLLSLFTKNLTLVEQLLINKANPNVTTLDENLSALHVLVSVPPSIEIAEILKLLLNYSADPNFKASTCHWSKEKQDLIGKCQLIEEDQGKTPLHLLCMRYDFKFDTERYLNDMALSLIKNGFDLKELYLGHTPLSIAMLRGNIELIKTILDSQLINPNQRLGENMGFSLTLFILKRYSDKLPDFEICSDIIANLIKYKANPFKQTLNIGNVIEFMIKEHEPPPSTKAGGKKNKKGKSKEKKKKDKKGKGKGKKGKKGKGKSTQEQVKAILISFTRSVLERHIKGWIVKYLFCFVQQENYYDETSETLAKFLKVDETIKIAQLLFDRGKLKKTESNYETLHDLIEMIINSNANKVKENIFPSSEVNIHELIQHFQFTRMRKEKGKLNLPEPETVKHNENFDVCYQCLRKQQRQLFACPKCKLIYFCSQKCNKLNLKVKSSIHKCGTLFYKEQEDIYLAARKRSPPLQFEPIVTNIEEITFGPTEREIKQDKLKLLHLGRHAKKCSSMTGFIFLSASDADLRKLLNEKFGIPRSKSKERSKIDSTWKTDKLTKKGKHSEIDKKGLRGYDNKSSDEFGNASHLKRSKSKRTKSSDNETDEDERKRTKYDASGKTNKNRKNKSDQDEDLDGNKDTNTKTDIHGKGKKTVGYGKDESEGKDKKYKDKNNEKKLAKCFNKGDNLNENKKGKTDKKEMSVTIMTKENLRGKSEKSYGKSEKSYGIAKSAFSNKENIIQQTGLFRNPEVKGKLDHLGLIEIENYEVMSGGKEVDLKRRLPQQYQHFLEKISEYWPDFDISLLFLPYACYKDGQLYYRFLTKQPVFMETYSTN